MKVARNTIEALFITRLNKRTRENDGFKLIFDV